MTLEEIKKIDLPKKPGSYQFFNTTGEIIYVGKAANLKSRVLSYWQKSTDHTPTKYAMVNQVATIKWVETDSEIEALLLESNFIKKYQPQFNVLLRDDKRYAYIKVSLDDEVPGVFITRNLDKAGKYYGPFTSTTALKETLKTIRKIWPYCTTRKIQKKPCFYYSVGRCIGVCGGVVTHKEYLDWVIKPIMLFFEGKKERIVKMYQKEALVLEKKLQSKNITPDEQENIEHDLRGVKYRLINMQQVLAHANILGLVDKYATDVVELAKILSLPKVPQRIEGYDISNTFGQESVGSMVVFAEGEPDKSQYRKFKIKINDGRGNDVGMLKEVMERRLNNDWPLPDLMIIDGGKGQLNMISRILKNNKLDIPVIAISKGEGLRSAGAPDKLFFPDQAKPLELPLASPALHLIKRVRDEAHRFAITFHRDRRSKAWLQYK
ncbi:MAG: excinuclease ABC subunit UvrC [Candidatus Falkowbacteria bacterium]